jgi:hypothetical protein
MQDENAFHNFEHASHVTMSVVKLLSMIGSSDQYDTVVTDTTIVDDARNPIDTTLGLQSDPLFHFACLFAAIIHDVDHCGVPNTQLMKENPGLASIYGLKSVAENNSIALAWSILMRDDFAKLRSHIAATNAEFLRFQQLVVNAVMATDIMDIDLNLQRNERWNQAFGLSIRESMESDSDRKASLVMEQLIQASDIAHTMQHWHIYRKWNERLFREMKVAYYNGRSDTDPVSFWYQREILFFDDYVIPLANKLAACGVFGVSSCEYLGYATKNRQEWLIRGEEIVKEMQERAKREMLLLPAPMRSSNVGDKGDRGPS